MDFLNQQQKDLFSTSFGLHQEKIHESGSPLLKKDKEKIQKSGNGQRKIILEIFSQRKEWLSCEEAWKLMPSPSLLTSVRRTCSNLYNEGILEKSEKLRKVSEYGIECCTYRKRFSN